MKNKLRDFQNLFVVEGILVFLWILLFPAGDNNIKFWGLSKIHFFMLTTQLLLLVGIAIFVLILFKKPKYKNRITTFLDKLINIDRYRTIIMGILFFGILTSLIFLWESYSSKGFFLENIRFYERLIPWVAWGGLICIQTAFYLIKRDISGWRNYINVHGLAFTSMIGVLLVGGYMHIYLWDLPIDMWDKTHIYTYDGSFDLEQQDIYQIYSEGIRLQNGVNPYGRVKNLGDDLSVNSVNTTYFPVFYLLTWFTQSLGFESFVHWLILWRIGFLVANLSIAALIFFIIYHRFNYNLMAVFAALFWLFSRWTLHITMIYHIEFLAIFFFLLSLSLWPRHQVMSLLAFGLSLGIKQIAIFMVPIYLIWIWQISRSGSPKFLAKLILAMVGIPLLSSLPFMIWDFQSFFRSILISATRISQSHFGIPAVDALMGLEGIAGKLPMLGLMAIVYILVWRRKIGPFVSALLVMAVFIDFNSVLFRQYMTWVVPLLPLAAMEFKNFKSD